MSTTTTTTTTTTASPQTQLKSSFNTLVSNYTSSTSPRIKLIDSFLLFLILSGVFQFAYRILVTAFPFNAFLGGCVMTGSSREGKAYPKNHNSFSATVGQFVLLAGLRSQIAPGRDGEFKQVTQERAFADFCAASVVLHLFAFNFLG
ncbi:oligosaccharyltransferase complex subunit epsilon, partial [Tremellales sp. Uapishka_1]